MTAVDMVRPARQGLDEETVRHELEGNICRCTGYHNIVKAIQAGAAKHVARGRRALDEQNRITITWEEHAMANEGIGARVLRKEDKRFITGAAATPTTSRARHEHAVFVR